MTLTVGICDDCPEQADLLKQYLCDHRGEDELTFVCATEPCGFLEQARRKRIGLAFLDIDMKGMDGIELGGRLRELYADTVLVYVTAHEEYALNAFRVRAFHYLIKPIAQSEVMEVLAEALELIHKHNSLKREKTLTIARKGETLALPLHDIACFEKVGHKVRAHITGGGFEEYYGNFKGLIELLDGREFVQCHQGYIASVAKIRVFRDKTLFLDGGPHIPVSRMFTEKVRNALARRLFAGRDGT